MFTKEPEIYYKQLYDIGKGKNNIIFVTLFKNHIDVIPD